MWFCVFILLVVGGAEQRKSLSIPRKITAKVISPQSVEVSWRDPDLINRAGAKVTRLYVIKYKEASDVDTSSDTYETVRSRQRKVKLSGLAPNTTYEICVKVVKNRKSSAWSTPITVTTDGLEDRIYMVRNLTAMPVASDAILLSWLPPEQSSMVAAYTILTQVASGKSKQRRDVANKEMLEYKVGNLQPHLLYSFRVQTMQKQSPHPISPAVLAQPFSDVPAGAPRDITLHVINSSHIVVTWQPPSLHERNGQLLGYTLQYIYGSSDGNMSMVTTNKSIREYILTDIIVNETYKIQIAANTINGTGPYSKWETVFVAQSNNTETVKGKHKKDGTFFISTEVPTSSEESMLDLLPLPPSEVKVVNTSESSVYLVWSAAVASECCPVVGYKILTTNYNDSSVHEVVRDTTHVHLTGLIPNTVYGASVTALTSTSESSPSEESIFTTFQAEPPKILFFQAADVQLGGDANLTCQCKGHETPQIEWYMSLDTGVDDSDETIVRMGEIKDSNTGIAENIRIISNVETQDTLTSSLLLSRVTQAAEGEFICIARNSLGSEQRRLYLLVYEPPRIVIQQEISVTTSATARLMCEAYGKPIPEVFWVHLASGVVYREMPENNKGPVYVTSVVENLNSSRQSYLVIRNSSVHDRGVYTCKAQSRAGKTEAQVMLNVKVPPPGPVHKIQTIPLSPSRVSVSWLPPLNYNYNIAYYQVSYRKKHGGQPLVFNTSRVGTELYDLDHAMEYLVGVIAGTDDSLGESGPEVEVMTLTNDGLEPANVTVKTFNTSIIQLDWEPPSSISPMYIHGYNVYSRRDGEGRTEKLFVKGSSSKQFLIGLGRDDTYFLKISTLMTWGYEAHSTWIRIQKRSDTYLPPGKPLIVTAVARLSEITLTWEPPSMGNSGVHSLGAQLKGFKIVYGPLNDPLNVSRATLGADTREFLITGLEPSTKYIISIRAFNDIGAGEPVYTRTITQAHPPSMVQNARAQPVSSTEIHVQWDPPRRGHVTRYHIRYWRPGRKDKQSAWLTGNIQNYVAGSLRKNSNYRFEIIPYNGELLGEGLVIFSYTYGDKPDGPPTDVSIRPLNSTALIASWNPPDPEKVNGQIIAYKLVLRTKGGSRMASFTVPGTANSYIFLNMPVSRTYKLRMTAITVNGSGVYSPWVECAFSSSPEKPAPPENLSVSQTETSLTLQWKPPKFTGSPVHGYIVGYGQFIPEVYRQIVGSTQLIYTIKSLKPDSEYITSVRAFNHIGESPPVFSIIKTKQVSPLAIPLQAPVKLMLKSESPTSLVVSWVDPSLSDSQKVSDGRAYLIRFSPLSGETYSYINTSHLQHQLSALESATMYEVSVKVVRGSNSSSWSLSVVNSTQQTAPSTAPENITASPLPLNPSLISLKWSEPRSPNGQIEEYIIYITSDPSLDTKLWVLMRTQKREVKIRDIIPYTNYYFKLQARNRAGYGPLSETVMYRPPSDIRAVPTDLSVTSLNGNMSTTVKLSWSVPEVSPGQITGYMIYYTDNIIHEDADWLVHTERGLDTVVVGLEYNVTYYFKVQARYSAAYGPFSKIVSYTTAPQELEHYFLEKFEENTKPKDNSRDKVDSVEAKNVVIVNNKDNSSSLSIIGSKDNSSIFYDYISYNGITTDNIDDNGNVSITKNVDDGDSISYNVDENGNVSITDNFDDNSVFYEIGNGSEAENRNMTDDDDDFNYDERNDEETIVFKSKNIDAPENEVVHESLLENNQNLPSEKSENNPDSTLGTSDNYDEEKDESETANVSYDYPNIFIDVNNISYSNTSHGFDHFSSNSFVDTGFDDNYNTDNSKIENDEAGSEKYIMKDSTEGENGAHSNSFEVFNNTLTTAISSSAKK